MSDAQFDPSLGSLQAAAAAASATALQNSIKTAGAVSGSADGSFNGTIGDLQKKYPEVYNKLIIESIGRQICQQCQDANDRFIAEIKKHENS